METPQILPVRERRFGAVFSWCARWRPTALRFASTVLAQGLVQALAFVSGIVVLRALPPAEYALYTLAASALGAVTLLSDGGITTGAMARGRLVHDDPRRLGSVLSTALALRRTLGALAVTAICCGLAVLLVRHGAGGWTVAAILLVLVPTGMALMSSGLLELVPRLAQDLKDLQAGQLVSNVLRLALTVALVAAMPNAVAALAAALVAQLWLNRRLRALAGRRADLQAPVDPAQRALILATVRKILPGALYYSLSGQIVVWLASIFASTDSVAQVGALGRLAMLLNILGTAIGLVIVPRFARLPADVGLLRRRFAQVQLVLGGLLAALLLLAWAWPAPLLLLLGPHYQGLASQLVLSLFAAALGLLGIVACELAANRGHVMAPGLNIGLSLATTVVLLCLVDCSTVHGILVYSACFALAQYVMWLVYAGSAMLTRPRPGRSR